MSWNDKKFSVLSFHNWGHSKYNKGHFDQFEMLLLDNASIGIGAKPNIYSEAIELVCGGSPIHFYTAMIFPIMTCY